MPHALLGAGALQRARDLGPEVRRRPLLDRARMCHVDHDIGAVESIGQAFLAARVHTPRATQHHDLVTCLLSVRHHVAADPVSTEDE